MTDERRAFQRLNLTQPVEGVFGGVPLRIAEVSVRGVLAETEAALQPGARGIVRFRWRGDDVESGAAVVWCENGRAGFRFDEISETLRGLLEDSVAEVLRDRGSDWPVAVVDGGEFPAADVYVVYTVDNGVWTWRTSLMPDQPPDGFTISPAEPQENVELLCRTFEHGDAETRRLTRLFAELSVTHLPLVR